MIPTAITAGTSRVAYGPLLLACRRQYPGRSDGIYSLVPFHHLRPSLEPGRVGSCITLFEACSAFTHVTACTLAKSPSDPLHQRLQQFRCLHCCSDCYRVERTSSRAGLSPAVDHHLSRRTRQSDLPGTTEDLAWRRTVTSEHGLLLGPLLKPHIEKRGAQPSLYSK